MLHNNLTYKKTNVYNYIYKSKSNKMSQKIEENILNLKEPVTSKFSKEVKSGVTVYHIPKKIPDSKMSEIKGTRLDPSQIDFIIEEDADVYSAEDNTLLLRFRKKRLNQNHIDRFYNNIISFAHNASSQRTTAAGTAKDKTISASVQSNIFGYFDTWALGQKWKFKKLGLKIPLAVRECRFNKDYPEKYKETIPLIQDIDEQYRKLTPDHYAKQIKKAKQTPFKIADTSFTTVTTNLNFQTTVHTDKGDDPEGFGNLVVIQKGKYRGGETCFPQYGVGVDMRTGDVLFMNVHEPHANLPIHYESKDAERLSIVCYLRIGVYDKSKGKTKKFMLKHNATMKKILEQKIVRKDKGELLIE